MWTIRDLMLSGALVGTLVAGLPANARTQTTLDRPESRSSERASSPAVDTLRLSLDRAEGVALEHNPFLRAARREEGVARGERRQAGIYRFNPRVEFESERLDPPTGESPLDRYEAVVAQEIEWAGQWGLRQDAAEHGLNRARASVVDTERRTLLDVRQAYHATAAADRKLAVTREIAELNRRLRDAVAEQLAEGEVSALDANLARIEHGRARGRVLTAQRERESALLSLTRVLGLDPDTVMVVAEPGTADEVPRAEDGNRRSEGESGVVPAPVLLPDPSALELDSLERAALQRRPDLLASEAAIDQANARDRLARREAIPNLRLLAPVRRTGPGGEPQVGLGVGLSIPLWNRNQGTADAREAALRQSHERRAGVALEVRTEVRDALQSYRSASEEARALRTSVLEPVRQNQSLLEEAYRAGKIDLPTLLLLRNQLLDAELAFWDAWLARRQAYARLRAAIGETPRPELEEIR